MVIEQELPVPIRGIEPGTWARSTIVRRLPEILERTVAENDFPRDVRDKLGMLMEEIPMATIKPLEDDWAPDSGDWAEYTAPHRDQNWLQVPWFFSEHYFYRRVMEAVDYFRTRNDPFLYQKELGYTASRQTIHRYAVRLTSWLESGVHLENLREVVLYSLWGNQADLSLWPADGDSSPDHADLAAAEDHLLADDAPALVSLFSDGALPLNRVDFLLDNAGFELITDLGLVDFLLTAGLVEKIVLHAKAHPTFVSDVVPVDVRGTVVNLAEEDDLPTHRFGARMLAHFEHGRVQTRPDFFWNSPLALWELPADLRGFLSGADLLISKGDANYRRVLGDRHWPFATPFADVVDYLPVPLAALRTLKAELVAGLDQGEIQRAREADAEWMVNGRWGLVQFAPAG